MRGSKLSSYKVGSPTNNSSFTQKRPSSALSVNRRSSITGIPSTQVGTPKGNNNNGLSVSGSATNVRASTPVRSSLAPLATATASPSHTQLSSKVFKDALDSFNRSSLIGPSTENYPSSMNEQAFIEDSYIKNLQQQIQFLEMELDLQRRLTHEEKQSLELSAEPLEDTIKQIKLKFVNKEKEYKQEIDALRREIEEMKKGEKSEAFKIKRLQEQLDEQSDAHQADLKQERQRFTDEIVENEKHINALENELHLKMQLIEGLEKEKTEILKAKLKLQNVIDDLEDRLKRKEVETKEKDLRITDLDTQVANLKHLEYDKKNVQKAHELEVEALREELEHYKDENAKLEQQTKNLELEKIKLESQKDRLEMEHRDLNQKIVQLQQQVTSLQKTQTQFQIQIKNLQKNEKELLTKQLGFEQVEKEYKKKIEYVTNDYHKLQENYAKLQDDFEHHVTLLDRQRNENMTLKYKEEQNKIILKQIEEQNEQLRKQNRALVEQVHDIEAKAGAYKKRNYALEMEACEMKAQIEELQKLLQLSSLIDELNRSDLRGLMRENQTVAEKIKQLVTFMPTLTSMSSPTSSSSGVLGSSGGTSAAKEEPSVDPSLKRSGSSSKLTTFKSYMASV